MRVPALIVIFLIGTAFAVPRKTERIVGGEATSIETYPFMAAMEYAWFGVVWVQRCAGALITSSVVLTASHCYTNYMPDSWRAQLGSSYFEDDNAIHIVAQRLMLHAGFAHSTLNNDVAIIRLSSAAPIGPNIATALIAGSEYILPDDTPLTAIGWGNLRWNGQRPSILQHVEVRTINWDTCAERYAFLKTQPGYTDYPDLTRGMVCSGLLDVGGQDACQGDSGGPVVHNGNVVYGITSWGFECANGTYPGVNAFVPFYTDWILTKVAER